MLPKNLDELDVTLQNNRRIPSQFGVQHFKPEQISVKVSNDHRSLIIKCKHEEKQDEHGQIYGHFMRKYIMPDDSDVKHLELKLSAGDCV